MTLVVAAALVAGMLSFLVATPEQSGRVDPDELGFAHLDTAHVFAAMGHAAEHHRAAHSAAMGARAATTTSRSWLVGVAGSSTRTKAVPANVRVATGRDASARRIAAFVEWADELPAPHWLVTTSEPVQVVGADRTWTVAAEVQVDVAQARSRTRRQVVPVELTLRGSVAEVRGTPRSWVVEDLIAGTSPGWLRAYRDPVLVGSGVVDVIAPATARAVALEAADTATAVLAPLATRYAGRSSVATMAVWMVERPARVRIVTLRAAPADVRVAVDGAPHAMAWADDRGDVVVDLSRFAAASAAARSAAIRHAVAHVATRQLTERAPAILAEGIALAEERRAGRAIVISQDEIVTLDQAFSAGTSGIAKLLAEPSATRLRGEPEQVAAAATIAWLLEERGARRVQDLLASIDAGMAPDTALRRTVGLAPRGVELQVAAWVRAQLPAATPDPTADEGAEVPTA